VSEVIKWIMKYKILNPWLPTRYNNNWINVFFIIKHLHLHLLWTITIKIIMGIVIIKYVLLILLD
jgi:hypothetical protein